jgi:ankyrin repeat protein
VTERKDLHSYQTLLIVKLLCAHGADLNSTNSIGETPLMLAADSEDLVRKLLQKGANVDLQETEDEWTALHYACRNGNTNVLELLLQDGADTELRNCIGETPLEMAIDEKQKICAFILLDYGAKVKESFRKHKIVLKHERMVYERKAIANQVGLTMGEAYCTLF